MLCDPETYSGLRAPYDSTMRKDRDLTMPHHGKNAFSINLHQQNQTFCAFLLHQGYWIILDSTTYLTLKNKIHVRFYPPASLGLQPWLYYHMEVVMFIAVQLL